HQLQALFAEALKTVWRRAWFEGSAADDFASGVGDDIGRALDLVAAFHAAGTGHHDDGVATDFDVSDLDDGALRAEATAGQFVWRADTVTFFARLHTSEHAGIEVIRTADTAENRVDCPGRTVYVEAVFDQTVHDALDLLFSGLLLHHD